MRGAEDARGHAAEVARRGPRSRPHRARALAGDVAESAAERAEAVPAGLKRNLGDRRFGVAQQRRRALDAPREEIAVRRYAERLLERAREVSLRNVAHAGKSPDGPVLVRGRVYPVFRAQQSPQQLGVLADVRHPTCPS